MFPNPRNSLEPLHPEADITSLPPYPPIYLSIYLLTALRPTMEAWEDDEPEYCKGDYAAGPGSKDIYVQLVISLALGFTALFAFCVSALRPRLQTDSPGYSPYHSCF